MKLIAAASSTTIRGTYTDGEESEHESQAGKAIARPLPQEEEIRGHKGRRQAREE
jgi:hypothetical protein